MKQDKGFDDEAVELLSLPRAIDEERGFEELTGKLGKKAHGFNLGMNC
ncbi:MAG: hypothetical protein ACP5LQ_09205 [Candidatus Methanodesulfokora sp.]